MPVHCKKDTTTTPSSSSPEQTAPPLPDQQTFRQYLRELARSAIRVVLEDVMVDDVDATYTHLVAEGAIPVAEPKDRPAWGMRTAHIADPDNNVIELYKPLPGSSFPEI